jgi:hypothetical protein
MHTIPAPQFAAGERVIADPLFFADCNPWRDGGPGVVVQVLPGDRYEVLLEGADEPLLYQARQLKKEPTV